MIRSYRAFGALLLLLTFTISSCRRDPFGIEGSGAAVSETRYPSNFNSVDLSIDADVVLHDDPNYRIEISAQSNILSVLKTSVQGSTLKIDFKRNVCNHGPITIHIYAPQYTGAALSGSGNIRNTDSIITPGDFAASISGSGNIDLVNMQSASVHSTISGSGSIHLTGHTQSVTTKTSGSGDMHLFDLIALSVGVTISGSGNVEINASQSLNVHISGSGDVYYKNNPAIDVDISGSGTLHHVQ